MKAQESGGKLTLDGRRLGFLYRNLLAVRSVELAKSEVHGVELPDLTASARHVVEASIPAGLNDEDMNREEAAHAIAICFDLLSVSTDYSAMYTDSRVGQKLVISSALLRINLDGVTCHLSCRRRCH